MDIRIYRLLHENYTIDLFRSEIYHIRDYYTDKEFIKIILKHDLVSYFWNQQQYYEALYILALLDYLSDKYKAPYLKKYEFYRSQKLKELVFPTNIIMISALNSFQNIKKEILKICEENHFSQYFLKYNIIEPEVKL